MSELTDAISSPESDYLYTQPSQITNAGLGLFTAITIYKKEIICYFQGEILNDVEATKRELAHQDQYFIIMLDGSIMDSKKVDCFAKYANDANGPGDHSFKNNAQIRLDDNGQVCLLAKRKIKSGEEIFCGYGKKYWKKHGV